MGAFSIWHGLIQIAFVPLFNLIALCSFGVATRRPALTLGLKFLDRQGATL